jgi:hypothetical protein
MPVRTVRHHGGNLIGMFPSVKMPGQTIHYESTIERDLCFVLEFDASVVSYAAQPFCITHTTPDGVTHRYTPDFQVVHASGDRDLVECKPAARLADPHTQQQITIGQTWADANDYTFVLITDADLRHGHRLANIKLLWRYRQCAVAPNRIARLRSYLTHVPGATIAQTAAAVLDDPTPSAYLPCLCHLLFHHIITTDLTHTLSPQSRLWLPVHASGEG